MYYAIGVSVPSLHMYRLSNKCKNRMNADVGMHNAKNSGNKKFP